MNNSQVPHPFLLLTQAIVVTIANLSSGKDQKMHELRLGRRRVCHIPVVAAEIIDFI